MPRFLTLIAALVVLSQSTTGTERPLLRDLLPQETLAYARVADYDDFLARIDRTALGRLARDPQLADFASRFLESLLDYQFPASAVVRRQGQPGTVAAAWRDSLAAASGEIVVAAVARPHAEPAWIVLIEGGPSSQLVQKLMEGELRQAQRHGVRRSERLGAAELHIVEQATSVDPLLALLVREDVYVLCPDADPLRQIARAWDRRQPKTIDGNPQYAKWQTWQQAHDLTAGHFDAELFIDVAALLPASAANGQQSSPQDGLILGGRVSVARDSNDVRLDAELLVGAARTGWSKMIALASDDATAEAWVPREAATYATVHWNLAQARAEWNKRHGATNRPNRAASPWDAASQIALPVALQDLEPHLAGRFSHASWFLPPASPHCRAEVLAATLNRPGQVAPLFEGLFTGAGSTVRKAEMLGQTYYEVAGRMGALDAASPARCCCLLDGWLLVANQPTALERAIQAARDPAERLAEQLDYRLVASKTRRLAGYQPPAAAVFARPGEFLRYFHEQLTDETARRRLVDLAVDQPLPRILLRVSQEQDVPPLALFDRWFAPCGGVLIDDGDAIRLTLFAIKRH